MYGTLSFIFCDNIFLCIKTYPFLSQNACKTRMELTISSHNVFCNDITKTFSIIDNFLPPALQTFNKKFCILQKIICNYKIHFSKQNPLACHPKLISNSIRPKNSSWHNHICKKKKLIKAVIQLVCRLL